MRALPRWVILCAAPFLGCSGGSDDSSNPAGAGGSGGSGGRQEAPASQAGRGGQSAPLAGRSEPSAGQTAPPKAGSSGAPAASGPGATLGSCNAFPADDVWNRVVENDPVSSEWTARVLKLVGAKKLHPDYGNSGAEHYGIPINRVPSSQPKVPITFEVDEESDSGPYPFPGRDQVRVEGGTATACEGDCHVLVVQEGECRLYEGYACQYASGAWQCYSGAIWDLTRASQGQRPDGYTSADAAGLAIAPGLVRYDEAQSGEITHAIRFTLHCTQASYVAPASHFAVPGGCKGNPDAPPMGLRVRLKASYDLSKLSGAARAVARAMQRYGMILADNGSDFYFQGEADDRFSEADVEPLKQIPVDAFEALEPGPLMMNQR